MRLRDQAQLDPRELVAALAADVRALGGIIVENAHVTGVEAGDPATTHTSQGDVRSERVHLTTGAPILDRGLYFAKTTPRRSLGMAFSGVDDLPGALYRSVDAPSRSIRRHRGDLIVSGNTHGTGRAASETALAQDLEDWTTAHWPAARRRRALERAGLRDPARRPVRRLPAARSRAASSSRPATTRGG